METKDIQKLLDYISKSDLDEVNIETSELKLSIKRSLAGHSVQTVQVPVQQAALAAPAVQTIEAPKAAAPSVVEPVAVQAPSNLIEVKSPMIGTFYRASGPDKPNFVEIGDTITEGGVICIVEAMKLFNEIESEISGKVVKILVEDASPIEFDQPLFLVEPI